MIEAWGISRSGRHSRQSTRRRAGLSMRLHLGSTPFSVAGRARTRTLSEAVLWRAMTPTRSRFMSRMRRGLRSRTRSTTSMPSASSRFKARETTSGLQRVPTPPIRCFVLPLSLNFAACERRVGFDEIVRGAGTQLASRPEVHLATWRILSGLTHGDLWASISLTDRDEVTLRADDGVYTVRTSSSVSNVANLTAIAVTTAEKALNLFDRRRVSPHF
jgi:hypothetical protein